MQRGLKSPLLFMPKKKIIEKMILLVPLVPYVPLVPHVPLVPGGYMEQGGTSGNKQPPIFTVCLFRAEKPCGVRVFGIPGTSGTSGTSILPKLIFFRFLRCGKSFCNEFLMKRNKQSGTSGTAFLVPACSPKIKSAVGNRLQPLNLLDIWAF